MLLTPKLAALTAASTIFLTGCDVNAPVNTNVNADIHDNVFDGTVNIDPNAIPGITTNVPNPFNTTDPNAPQDIPNSWDGSEIDPVEPVPIPEYTPPA